MHNWKWYHSTELAKSFLLKYRCWTFTNVTASGLYGKFWASDITAYNIIVYATLGWMWLSVPIVITCSVVPQRSKTLESGMVVFPQPHFSSPLEKWVSPTAYTNFVEVCRNAGTLFFAINAWCHQRLHSRLHANDRLAKNMLIGDSQITHTISCIINNEWWTIKSHFFVGQELLSPQCVPFVMQFNWLNLTLLMELILT